MTEPFTRLLHDYFAPHYPAQAINQRRTEKGDISPKAPAGIAEPVGWHLDAEGQRYIKD